MNIASYQFLRNQTPAFSLNEAKSVLEGHVGNSIDGEIVIARYTDGDSEELDGYILRQRKCEEGHDFRAYL